VYNVTVSGRSPLKHLKPNAPAVSSVGVHQLIELWCHNQIMQTS